MRIASLASTIATLITASLSQLAFAGPDVSKDVVDPKKEPTPPAKEETWCDKLFGIPVIYKNDDASFLNEFRFTGRFHGDVYHIDSDGVGKYDQDWIVRRARAGIQARFFHNLELKAEADFDLQYLDPAYQRLTDAYLAWKFSDMVKLTVGKQSAKFTLDGSTPSWQLLTIDRNNLSNNLWFTNEYFAGVSLSGNIGQWQYNTGLFSGSLDNGEFGSFDAGNFWLASVGYDFAKILNVKKALLRADYVYNDTDPLETGTRLYEQVGAVVFILDAGRWGFSADFAAGRGLGTQSDVFGVDAMPWFNITDKLQVVARYTYMSSSDPRGIRLNRYDNTVSSVRGDEYHEIYGGVNYFFCGHRLKVQTGVSYVTMNDTSIKQGEYHSVQWTTGFRLTF